MQILILSHSAWNLNQSFISEVSLFPRHLFDSLSLSVLWFFSSKSLFFSVYLGKIQKKDAKKEHLHVTNDKAREVRQELNSMKYAKRENETIKKIRDLDSSVHCSLTTQKASKQ